jgi:hypothetical protein
MIVDGTKSDEVLGDSEPVKGRLGDTATRNPRQVVADERVLVLASSRMTITVT